MRDGTGRAISLGGLGHMADLVGHARGRAPLGVVGPFLGQETRSVAACTLTATWQLARLSNTPQYCRATPTDARPRLLGDPPPLPASTATG
jgi:hypothetical protein